MKVFNLKNLSDKDNKYYKIPNFSPLNNPKNISYNINNKPSRKEEEKFSGNFSY